MEIQKIRIDLAKEIFNFSEISNLSEIQEIRFDNYTEKIEIPLTINEYPNITRLSFYGESRENLYETPDNLEQFIHIKHLTLWSYCDFTKIKPIPHLQELHTVVKNTETETKLIIALFPNLKQIEIWGHHLKEGTLPTEIENLIHLESIDLISCGLKTLPDSFKNLKNLKKIRLAGLPMNTFPEVLTYVENLESLEIRATLAKIPDSLSRLKKLKQLNLSGSLNEARVKITGKGDENLYLRPIPEAIGKLENLEELNLDTCGVFDISPITSLKKLKKLDIKYSALKNCDDFSNLIALEELNLENSYDLKNLQGLKGLPIKKLNVSSNYMKSIEVISTLEYLETFNIENCDYIKDYSPIYNHVTLKELKADTEILKIWKKKDKFKALPSIETLIKQLEANDILQFEETISHLSKHVKANYSDENNPLASFFTIQTEDEEITEIEILDNAIKKHIKKLSEETLVTIFEMTFKSVGFDNYNAALLVLEEIIERKNIDTQKKIIKQFYNACEDYETGHRFWGYTVHDQLIDDLFSQFTSEALYELLKKAPSDMLNSESGDQMDPLFVPAFQNTTNEKLHNNLLKVFFKYREEARDYLSKEYFVSLLQQIKDIATPKLEKTITTKKEANKKQDKIWELLELLKNLNEDNLPKIIKMLGNAIPKKIESEYLSKIIETCQEKEINEETTNQLIVFLIQKKDTTHLASVLPSKYHKTNPEKIIAILNRSLMDNLLNKNEIYNLTRMMIINLVPNREVLFDDLEIYRNFITSKCNITIDAVYDNEIQKLLSNFFDPKPSRTSGNQNYLLEKVKEIFNKTETEFSYIKLEDDLYSLVNNGKNKQCRTVFNYLYPRLPNYQSEKVLYLNVVAAIMLNDSAYFDAILKEIQKIKEITHILLAFNLACAFAVFGRKDEMLFHIKKSIRLGKMKQQFLDETDFKKYWNDEDFLKIIEEE